MDTSHEFEWDERKRRSNHAKHGIDFVEAIAVFGDPYLTILEDDRASYDEYRFHAIGNVKGNVILVVFTLRDEITRLISARKATVRERRTYYENAR